MVIIEVVLKPSSHNLVCICVYLMQICITYICENNGHNTLETGDCCYNVNTAMC